MIRRAVLYGALLVATAARAQEAVTSSGMTTCAVWMRDPKTHALGTQWLVGYWTAFEEQAGAPFNPKADPSPFVAAVAGVCRGNPDVPLEGAFSITWLKLHPEAAGRITR
jgi:hypothetical protein